MMIASLPPFIIFFAGALLLALAPKRFRPVITLLIPVVGLINMATLDHGMSVSIAVFDYDLIVLRVDRLSMLFGWLFHIATLLGAIYALHVKDLTQQTAAIVYAGGALGAVFVGDLLSLFIFWELLAVSSVFLIWARRTPAAYAAGIRYLIYQILSGVILMAGALLYVHNTGSISFTHMQLDGVAPALIFIAFGIKCAFPFLHTWLTDAYPEATPTGTVFLSAFTTKVAVYALARGFAGTEILIYIGAVMTCFPIFYAVIENDLRRVLAYSMINQIGFMVCGIGIGTELALNGAVSHAFNDVIFKGLLMMTMGAVLYRTGKIDGSDLGGLYKSMPKTTTFCIIGAASISAFPLFSGFVSKSMVMTAALEQGYWWVWLMLLFASAGVFHHAGIKIPFFAFFSHDSGIRVKEAPGNMLAAMAIAAALSIFIGCYPWLLYDLLPYATGYNPFDSTHVLAQLQLLFFSALAFTWLKLKGLYPPELHAINLDVDWTFRKLLPEIIDSLVSTGKRMLEPVRGVANKGYGHVVEMTQRLYGENSRLGGVQTVGATIAIALFVFALILLWELLTTLE
jgi:multicomponent Na+:H+ antiporter subunit D